MKPALGVQVTLGTMRGQVVRHFEDGVAIEFAVIQRPETLDAQFNSPKARRGETDTRDALLSY